MRRVFADTQYFLALLNKVDEHHLRAAQFTAAYDGKMYTTDWVLTELADGLSAARTRLICSNFIQDQRNDPDVFTVPAERALFNKALKLYADRPDKDWSLTDCISFIAMQESGIADALTADHHFEQAGFRALLK